jgi:hypothetical protein
MKIERRFTTADQDAYAASTLTFTTTVSEIRNPDGTVVFRNDAVRSARRAGARWRLGGSSRRNTSARPAFPRG